MSESNPSVRWYGRDIFLSEKYTLCFNGKREMTKEQTAHRELIMSLPEKIRMKTLLELAPTASPYTQEVTGRQLIEIAKMGNLVPQFDEFFESGPGGFKGTRKVQLIPFSGIQFFKEAMLERLKASGGGLTKDIEERTRSRETEKKKWWEWKQ